MTRFNSIRAILLARNFSGAFRLRIRVLLRQAARFPVRVIGADLRQ